MAHDGENIGEGTADFPAGREQGEDHRALEDFMETLRPLGALFARNGYSLRVDPQCPSFAFDHSRREVIISPTLVTRLHLTASEQKFACCHELGHLVQLLSDPKSYLRTFDIAEERGKVHGGQYEKAIHRFFNVFLDVHDNAIVRAKMPLFQRGGAEEQVIPHLYEQKLFAQDDLREDARSQQWLNAILRQVMAPRARTQVSDDVAATMGPVRYLGRQYPDLVTFVRERLGDPTATLHDVLFALEHALLPTYERLLAQDIQDGRAQDAAQGSGEELDEHIDPDQMRRAAEKILQDRQSPQQRYDDHQRHEQDKQMQDEGYTEDERRRFEDIETKTRDAVRVLEFLWDRFIERRIEHIQRERQGGWKRGAGVDPTAVAQQIGILLTNPEQARVCYRYLSDVQREDVQPKLIRLVLLPDLSGSMHEGDKAKLHRLEEASYALLKSLVNFSRSGRLAAASEGMAFPVGIDYRTIGYGSQAQEFPERPPSDASSKHDTRERSLDTELRQIVMFLERTNLSGTHDDTALARTENLLTPERRDALARGDEVWVVLQVTDGETETLEESRAILERLHLVPGIHCRAIQISESGSDASGTFQSLWGPRGERLTDVNTLMEVSCRLLAEALTEAE